MSIGILNRDGHSHPRNLARNSSLGVTIFSPITSSDRVALPLSVISAAEKVPRPANNLVRNVHSGSTDLLVVQA